MKIYKGEWPEKRTGRRRVVKPHIVNAILQGDTVVIEQSDHPTLDLQKIANLYRNHLRNGKGGQHHVQVRVLRSEGIVLVRLVDEGTEF